MNFSIRLLGLSLTVALLAACSGTEITSSWLNKNYKKKINNVYIIGIAKDDFNRMFFENTFYSKLASEGVNAIPSSTDLPKNEETAKEVIVEKMKANNCDTVLLTKIVNQETTSTFNLGKGSYRYVQRPTPPGVSTYDRPTEWSTWPYFYTTGQHAVYVAPTTTSFVVLTVETAIYDLHTEELIWAARTETDLGSNLEKVIQEFVDEVVKNLKKDGLI